MIFQNRSGGVLHRRESGSRELVGINDDVRAELLPFLLVDSVERGRNEHDRRISVFRTELFNEFLDLGRVLLAAMDHDCVRAGLDECECTRQSVLHAAFQDEAFDSGADHEVARFLRGFARPDLRREVFDAVLRLLDFGAEQAVLFQPGLILDDDHGNAHAFERAHRVDEMFRETACVAVEDDRLRGDFHDVIDRAEARGHVDELNVGLSLGRAVAKRTHPHPVELLRAAVLVHAGLFHDETGNAAVSFHDGHEALHLKQFLEAGTSDVRERKLGLCPVVEVLVFLVVRIRIFDKLAAICGQDGNDLVPDRLLKAGHPVVAVNDEIRLELFKVFLVGKRLLFHDLVHTGDITKHHHAFRGRNERETFVVCDGFVRKDTDDQFAELLGFLDDLDMTAMDDVCGKRHVDRAVFDFLQSAAHVRQILGIVDFLTEQVLNVQSIDVGLAFKLVQRVFGIDFGLVRLAELNDYVKPELPIVPLQEIERLRFHRVIEELNADLQDHAVLYDRLEILLRKRQSRGNSHAGNRARDELVKDFRLENDIAMHENDIVVQIISCAVDAVNVIRGGVNRIVDKRELKRKIQALTVVYQYTVKQPRRHDDFIDSGIGQKPELSGEDCFPRADLGHAFRVFGCQDSHAGAKTGIKNESFHDGEIISALFGWVYYPDPWVGLEIIESLYAVHVWVKTLLRFCVRLISSEPCTVERNSVRLASRIA